MEQIYYLKTEFPAVFLLNGSFCEGGKFSYSDTAPLYITVLPLEALLIPYTVKVLNGRVIFNSEFCSLLISPNQENLVVLKPRYNYVYAPQHSNKNAASALPVKLFSLLKDKALQSARELLTIELNDSVDDDSLLSFFDEYSFIIDNDTAPVSPMTQSFYLVDSQNVCHPFSFYIKNGKIDNISDNKLV